MPFLIEHLIEIVFLLFLLAVLGNFFLIGIALARRQRRQKFFAKLDSLREQYSPIVSGMLSGQIPYPEGLQKLRAVSGPDRLSMLEHLCLEKRPSPEEVPVLRRLSEDLGLVNVWQQRLMGQFDPSSLREALTHPQGLVERVSVLQFLIRAKSAENLGAVRHEASWPLLVKALEDPHPDLQVVAARSLAALQHPASFPALAAQLPRVVLKGSSSLSLRALKAALVSFPLDNADELLPVLRHSNPSIRFLATDIIREMVEREACGDPNFLLDNRILEPELAEVFLAELAFDPHPDVRARAASVISHLADPRTVSLLLILLEDATWFVRLHAVRSLGKWRYWPQAEQIAGALTDPNWRVREAAVHTLRCFGSVGRERLLQHFLDTEDRYSREQISDEFQRAGLIPELLTEWVETGSRRATRVIRDLVEMGKTSYIVSVLVAEEKTGRLPQRFLQEFGHSPDPQIHRWVEELAEQDQRSDLKGLAQATLAQSYRAGGS